MGRWRSPLVNTSHRTMATDEKRRSPGIDTFTRRTQLRATRGRSGNLWSWKRFDDHLQLSGRLQRVGDQTTVLCLLEGAAAEFLARAGGQREPRANDKAR